MTENEFVVEVAYRLGELSGEMKSLSRDLRNEDVFVIGRKNSRYEAAIEDVLDAQ